MKNFLFILIACATSHAFAQNQQNPFNKVIQEFRSAPRYNQHFTNLFHQEGIVGGVCFYPNGKSEESILQTIAYEPGGPAFPKTSKFFIYAKGQIQGLGYSTEILRILESYNPVVFNGDAAVSVGNPTPAWFGRKKPFTGVLFLKYSSNIVRGVNSAVVLETANEPGQQNKPTVRACYFYEPMVLMY